MQFSSRKSIRKIRVYFNRLDNAELFLRAKVLYKKNHQWYAANKKNIQTAEDGWVTLGNNLNIESKKLRIILKKDSDQKVITYSISEMEIVS